MKPDQRPMVAFVTMAMMVSILAISSTESELVAINLRIQLVQTLYILFLQWTRDFRM